MYVCICITFLLIRMFCINPSMKINYYEVNFFMINNNLMTRGILSFLNANEFKTNTTVEISATIICTVCL